MTKKEYKFYLEADRIIAGRPARTVKRKLKLLFTPDVMESFMLIMRKVEYLRTNGKKGVLQKIRLLLATNKYNRTAIRLGFSINPGVFGPGLYIPHHGTIVINGNAKVGANCVLHTCTCIAGSEVKNLGDNLYISTGAVISGAITLGDNVTISANSLVNKSFNDNNVLIGGLPAKILKERGPWYEYEDEQGYAAAVKQIEELRKTMFG